MKLVEDDERDAFEGGICMQHAGEYPFGDHLDTGGSSYTRLAPDPVPDRFADLLPQHGGHISGD